jgi:hypothetical protein
MNLLKRAVNLLRPSTKADMSICVGQTHKVGSAFLIKETEFIGFDKDAEHEHGISCKKGVDSGSVGEDCTVTIRAIEGDWAVVRLDRAEMPFGVRAPNGTVFQIHLDKIRFWASELKRQEDRESRRRALAEKYCT